MKTKLFLILGVFLFFTMSFVSADQTITIQVNNIYTGEPIENAIVDGHVMGWNTPLDGLTNSEGIVTFQVPDDSVSSVWASKYAHSKEWLGYVSHLTNNNYLQGNLTPLYLFKQVSDGNVEITFNLIGNRPDVTYDKNERFNNFLQIKNIGNEDVVFDSTTFIDVGYFYSNSARSSLEWGNQSHSESLTIHSNGYFYLEAIEDDVKLCASGAYVKGIEIGLSSKICMTTPALDKNIIPDYLNGLFYGVVDVSYKIDSIINNIQLTTDNFIIDNYDVWWAIILAKLNDKFDEFGDNQRATNDVTVANITGKYVPPPTIGNLKQYPTPSSIKINLKNIPPVIEQEVLDVKSIKWVNKK